MRANEFITENFGVQVYPGVIPFGEYLGPDPEFAPPGNYRDSAELHDEVYDLIDAGIEPQVVNVNPTQLLATQDWLSNAGGDDPLFDEYTDKPVVYQKADKFYILDGHHRTTRALKAGRPISVYLFTDEQDEELDENFADGKNPGRKGLAKRVGVNCKQPVSKLRSIAAHSSGEKQRMAHWCANMKSGKSKTNESKVTPEHFSTEKLDDLLKRCIKLVRDNGMQRSDNVGRVAACIVDTRNRKIYGTTTKGPDGKWIHAEQMAIKKYQKEFGKIHPGAIIVTTLSPCNRGMHDRHGPSCQDLLQQVGIEKVYTGYMDPTQHSDHPFDEEVTKNDELWRYCKELSDSFVHQH